MGGSRGPGLMGTMAATATGAVAGNMIANSLMGGRHTEASAVQQAPEEQQVQQQSSDLSSGSMPLSPLAACGAFLLAGALMWRLRRPPWNPTRTTTYVTKTSQH